MRRSLIIVGFFVFGCLAGIWEWIPFEMEGSSLSTYILYLLMFCVGISLGNDKTLVAQLRRLDVRLALLPVMTIAGTLAGCIVASLLIRYSWSESMAVGSGFAYYSLSSIFISEFKGIELGTIALLCNVMREIFTLLFVPVVYRWFGPLSAISIGGATTFDTTLPIITRSAGKEYAVVSIYHGCVLDFSVPVLVTLFCSI
jgi:uncharacterized membrane protein YbjE (DUF340 family)